MSQLSNRLRSTLVQALTVVAVASGGLGQAMAETRTVESAYGPVQINGQPGRVVTLYEGALDAALAVDANAVGAVITRGGSDVAEYIKSEAGDIAIAEFDTLGLVEARFT